MKRIIPIITIFYASLGFFACTRSQTSSIPIENPISGAQIDSVTTPTGENYKPSATLRPTTTPTEVIHPTPVPITPTQTCNVTTGDTTSNHVSTRWLSEPLAYRVYTPPCYDQNRDQRYPVLYLIHGYGSDDEQWLQLGIDQIADRLINEEGFPAFILVLPYDSDHNKLPPENAFGEALIHDLIPAIDAGYRTLQQRDFRAIGGLSRGGNWAIQLGLMHWQLFGAIGGHSAPLFVTDGPPKIKAWLTEIPDDKFPNVYLDIGMSDKWLDHTLRLEEILDNYNVPHELHIFSGGHNEEYWASHTEQYIRWYTSNW